jgi:aminopeptidase
MEPDERRRIARKIVRDCAAVTAGENVYIEGRADSLDYLELLALECELAGAKPLVVAQSDEHLRRRLDELSSEQLATRAEPWIAAVKAADVVLTVRLEDGKPGLFTSVPPEKTGADRRGRKLLADHIYDGTRRWIGTDYPTRDQADAFRVGWDEFESTFWRALDVDYRLLQERAERICAVLQGADAVRIRSPKGTDVTLRIAGRPLDQDVGVVTPQAVFSNLPAGEVCLAPLEDGANGRVVFDLNFWDGVRIEDLEVRFEAGRCIPLRAKTGFETFTQTVAAASGAGDVIGELGIGLNPEVKSPTGYMLTDEKILGTIHLALGDNRMLGGVNESSLHWDLLVMDATLEADGRAILRDGRLALEN